MQTFTLTETHLKLLRRFQVGWQDCETGAPEIDPKRPYGNSAVPEDMHTILTGETIGFDDSKRDALTLDERKRYLELHRETKIALQIVLATGQFKPGMYECEDYSAQWREREATVVLDALTQFTARMQAIADMNDDLFTVDITFSRRGYRVQVTETADKHVFLTGTGATLPAALDAALSVLPHALKAWNYKDSQP